MRRIHTYRNKHGVIGGIIILVLQFIVLLVVVGENASRGQKLRKVRKVRVCEHHLKSGSEHAAVPHDQRLGGGLCNSVYCCVNRDLLLQCSRCALCVMYVVGGGCACVCANNDRTKLLMERRDQEKNKNSKDGHHDIRTYHGSTKEGDKPKNVAGKLHGEMLVWWNCKLFFAVRCVCRRDVLGEGGEA